MNPNRDEARFLLVLEKPAEKHDFVESAALAHRFQCFPFGRFSIH